jgi:hypothetical protein
MVPMTPAPAKESVTVVGLVTGVEVKPNEQFVVKVRQNPTDQYDLSLRTKDAALANFLMSQVGQQYQFVCGLSHWTNSQGQPVTSKWINQYAAVGQNVPAPTAPALGAPAAPTPAPAAPASSGPREDRDLKITWLSMAKGLAVECYKRLPTDQQTLDNAVKIADYWAKVAMHRGANGIPEWGEAMPGLQPTEVYSPATSPGPNPDDGAETPPPPGDDDIPF